MFLLFTGSSASADYHAISNNGGSNYYLSNDSDGQSNHSYSMSDIYASYIFTKAVNTGDSAKVAYNTIATYPADYNDDHSQTYGVLKDPSADSDYAKKAGYQFATAAKTLYDYHYLNTVYPKSSIFGYIAYLFTKGGKTLFLGHQLKGAKFGADMYNAGSGIVEKMSAGVNSINIPYIVTNALHLTGDNSSAMSKLKSETNTKGGTGLVGSVYESILSIFQISGQTFRNIGILFWIGILLWFVIVTIVDISNPNSGRSKIWTRVKVMAFRVIVICCTLQLTAILTGVINNMNKQIANGIAGPEEVTSGYVVNSLKYAATLNLALGPINQGANLPDGGAAQDVNISPDKDFAPTVQRVQSLNSRINAAYASMSGETDSANINGTDQSMKSAESASNILNNIIDQKTVGVNDYFAMIADAKHGAGIAAAYTVDGGTGHLGNAWNKQTQAGDTNGGTKGDTLQNSFPINNKYAAFLNTSSYSAGDGDASSGGSDSSSGSGSDQGSDQNAQVNSDNVTADDIKNGNVYIAKLGGGNPSMQAKFLFGPSAKYTISPIKWYDPSTYIFGYVPAGGMSDEQRYTANYFDGQGDANHQNNNPETGKSFGDGGGSSSSSSDKDKDKDSSDKDDKDKDDKDKDDKDKDSKKDDKAVFNQSTAVSSIASAKTIQAAADKSVTDRQSTLKANAETVDVNDIANGQTATTTADKDVVSWIWQKAGEWTEHQHKKLANDGKKTENTSHDKKASSGKKKETKSDKKKAETKKEQAKEAANTDQGGSDPKKALENQDDNKKQNAMQYNAAIIALNNRYNGIANMGGNVNSFSTQSTAFLLQTYQDGDNNLAYKGDNTAPNTAGQSANTGSDTVQFAKYTIPYQNKTDFIVKLSGITNVWIIAGLTMLATIIYLFRAPFFEGYWKMTKNYFSAQFLGNFGGLINYLVYYAATLLTFSAARVATLIMSQLYVGVSNAIANVPGFKEIAQAHAIKAAATRSLTGGWAGLVPSVMVIVFGILAILPMFSVNVGNKVKKTSLVGIIVLFPYAAAELIEEDVNYLQQRIYGRGGRDGFFSRLTGQKMKYHPEYAKQAVGNVAKGAVEAGMAVASGGTSALGKLGLNKAAGAVLGKMTNGNGEDENAVEQAQQDMVNGLGLSKDNTLMKGIGKISDKAAGYTGIDANDPSKLYADRSEANQAAAISDMIDANDPSMQQDPSAATPSSTDPSQQPSTNGDNGQTPVSANQKLMNRFHDNIQGGFNGTARPVEDGEVFAMPDPNSVIGNTTAANGAEQLQNQAQIPAMFDKDKRLLNARTGKEIDPDKFAKAFPDGIPAEAIGAATGPGNGVNLARVMNAEEIGKSVAQNARQMASNEAVQNATEAAMKANDTAGHNVQTNGDTSQFTKEVHLQSGYDPNMKTSAIHTAGADAAAVKHANDIIRESNDNAQRGVQVMSRRIGELSKYADQQFAQAVKKSGGSLADYKGQMPSQQISDKMKDILKSGIDVPITSPGDKAPHLAKVVMNDAQLKSLNTGDAGSMMKAIQQATQTAHPDAKVNTADIAKTLGSQMSKINVKTTPNGAAQTLNQINQHQMNSIADAIKHRGQSVAQVTNLGQLDSIGDRIAKHINTGMSAQESAMKANDRINKAIQKAQGINPDHPDLQKIVNASKNLNRAAQNLGQSAKESHWGKAARYAHDTFFANENSQPWIGGSGQPTGGTQNTPTGGNMSDIENELRKMRQQTHDDLRDLNNRQ